MKSQGLPMTFIVITAMVILVLIVVILIFTQSTTQTQAFDQQTAVNNCNSQCFLANQYTNTVNKADFTQKESGFCTKVFDVRGVGTGMNCEDLVACSLTFKDGSGCSTECSGDYLKCV